MRHRPATSLDEALTRSGYYPALVRGVLDVALGGEDPTAWLVHPETTIDESHVHRHLTALVLTGTRLIVAHVDDELENGDESGAALATTETVALSRIVSLGLTHGMSDPSKASAGSRADELTIAVNWGAVRRADLEPVACNDPHCEADHGYTGLAVPEDVVLRVSALAEGAEALDDALAFATALSGATAAAIAR